jgi:hypothetical protein
VIHPALICSPKAQTGPLLSCRRTLAASTPRNKDDVRRLIEVIAAHPRLVGIVVTLANHPQRPAAERDLVTDRPVRHGGVERRRIGWRPVPRARA